MNRVSDKDAFHSASKAWVEACNATDVSLLDAPTPCANWSVADLLDHVTGGNRFTVAILNGESAAQALLTTQESFDDDHRPVAAAIESMYAQARAVEVANGSNSMFDHPAGQLTLTQLLRLRVHDLSIHTWDLHIATESAKGLDSRYVRWAIEELADPASLAARHMATGFKHPTKPYELLMAFGRSRNHWNHQQQRD